MVRSLTSSRRAPLRGFTLLELIIVLVVLVALAALVVPTLGWVREQSKYATAASGAAEVLKNLETYRAATGKYPDRMESLVATGGSSPYTKIYSGLASMTSVDDSSTSSAAYYLRHGSGVRSVMQHDSAATDANESTVGIAPTETVTVSHSLAPLLAIKPNDSAVSNSRMHSTYRAIVRTAYPNQANQTNVAVPTGHTLVAMGIGSRTSCVGSTMSSAPVCATADDGEYSRFIAWFDVSRGPAGRGQVQLKLVTDSQGQVLASNVSRHKAAGPTDDAGDGTPPPVEEETTP